MIAGLIVFTSFFLFVRSLGLLPFEMNVQIIRILVDLTLKLELLKDVAGVDPGVLRRA